MALVKQMVWLKQLFQRHWRTNRSLGLLVIFSLACLLVSAIGLAFDSRLINGEHAWIKPCKFSISLAVYGLTLMWLSQFLTGHTRFFRGISVAALIGTVVELSAIILQVIRGTTSHFNNATPFDQAVFVIVVSAIVPVSFGLVAVYVMLLRERNLPPVLGLTLRWGLFLSILGLIPGVLMLLPDHMQDLITSCKQFDGHTIGYAEGGPGIPWLGWSTVAGDLRVAHFTGLHAMQILPVVGFLILRLFPDLAERGQTSLVWNVGFTYLSCILLLMWQALSGESIAAPSIRTVLTASVVLAVSSFWATRVLLGTRLALGSIFTSL